MIETQLNERVHTALGRSPYLAGRKLRIDAEHGRITIHGVVRSYFQKQMAQEAVRRIDGVEDILNQLEVLPAIPA
jgi:osmotically-inducible protein OsmY